jgi:primosomal protein N' (replication factor Y)
MKFVRVALDVPLEESFDFVSPARLEIARGALVIVPFGRSRKVGVVVGHSDHSDIPRERLREVESLIDDVAPFSAAELELFEFCASYYQRALGEVIAASLPPRLRQVSRRRLAPVAPAAAAPRFTTPVTTGSIRCCCKVSPAAARPRSTCT